MSAIETVDYDASVSYTIYTPFSSDALAHTCDGCQDIFETSSLLIFSGGYL